MPNGTLQDTPSTPFYFQFILRGHIELEDSVNYLVCPDNTRFRLKESSFEASEGITLWQVIPTTDTSGMLQTVSLERYETDDTCKEPSEECCARGRVVQLGKRGQFVQLKIPRPGEKTLKISFLSPDPRMKIGQVWQVVARRYGYTLRIHKANPVEEEQNSPVASKLTLMQAIAKSVQQKEQRQSISTVGLEVDYGTTSTASSSKSPSSTASQNTNIQLENSPPPAKNDNSLTTSTLIQSQLPDYLASELDALIEKARTALIEETQIDHWELGLPKQRKNKLWEWEAVSRANQLQARVQVFGNGKKARVYQYPSTSDIPETLDIISDNQLVVTPLGAAKGIGASCFQVLIGPYEIVLDCGTRPKGYDPLPALEYLENPDLLLISHAHQDHLGAVPVFHSRWPGVRMICTPGTREIAHVMLTDCLKVQQMNEDSPQLFDEVDLERTLFRLETEPIGREFEPLPGLKVRFINAGHILGAACIYMRYGDSLLDSSSAALPPRFANEAASLTENDDAGKRSRMPTRSLLYTGDYNTTSSRITTGLQLSDLPTADILITESTYGADVHPARKTQETALIEAIAEVIQAGGNVLIPAFALGRAQEIILAIRTSNLFHKLRVPVYVDGLVRAVTDVFRDNLELLPPSVQNLVKQNGIEPFCNPTGTPPIIPIASPRERPLAMAHPSVIVASSGMLTGGPSVYYAATLLERDNAAIFISGYTDEESPGRLLQNLETGDKIELDGKEITVRAQIRRFNLSAHADKVGLGQVINKVNPKHLILIHGGGKALHELARSGDLRSKHYIHIPTVGERVEYGQAPYHLSSTQISRIELPQEFEVEIEAEVEGAWLRIPEEVVENDPRWQMFASSGILKAKWDGFHLKLSPVTQQSIARQKAVEDAIASGENCCALCQFFESGSCQCEESALFELQVDPTGVCTEFTEVAIKPGGSHLGI